MKEKAWDILEREMGVKPQALVKQIGQPASTVYTVLSQDAVMQKWKSGGTLLDKKR